MTDSPDNREAPGPVSGPVPAPETGAELPAPAAPAPPAQLPNSEVAAEMATKMLNSAISQKNAIADSFRAQREAVLEAVAAQKRAIPTPVSPPSPAPAAAPPPHPAAAVPAEATPEPTDQAPAAAAAAPSQAAAPQASAAAGAPPASGEAVADPAQVAQSLLKSPEFGALLGLLNNASNKIDALLVARQIVETLKDLVAREVSAQLATRQKDQG